MRELVAPKDWEKNLWQHLDFDRAYAELEGYEHFHTYALRGYVRNFQLRPLEALELYDEAEARVPEGAEWTPEFAWRFASVITARLESLRLAEALGIAVDRDGGVELVRLEQLPHADSPRNRRLILGATGPWRLSRGNFEEALRLFETLIHEARDIPERVIGAYLGAMAALHQIGEYKKSRRHYENAQLCMAFTNNRLAYCYFLSWLLALCTHWGWDSEATRWRETIAILECPAATRAYILRRADLLARSCKRSGALAMA